MKPLQKKVKFANMALKYFTNLEFIWAYDHLSDNLIQPHQAISEYGLYCNIVNSTKIKNIFKFTVE